VHVHLVNNSVAKYSEDFHKKVFAENGVEIVDCMWSMKQIASFMQFRAKELGIFKGHDDSSGGNASNNVNKDEGEDVFSTRCMGRMRDIAKYSLMSAQGQVEHRKNSWELYGFDYMFDDDFMPWLIEINSSPACDYSTPTTEDFVPRALTDVLKVVVDLREKESNNNNNSSSSGGGGDEKVDTGGWERVYKGPVTDATSTALGVDLACQGIPIRLKSGFRTNNKAYDQPEWNQEEEVLDAETLNTQQQQAARSNRNSNYVMSSPQKSKNIPSQKVKAEVPKTTPVKAIKNPSADDDDDDDDDDVGEVADENREPPSATSGANQENNKQTQKGAVNKQNNKKKKEEELSESGAKLPPQFTMKRSLLTKISPYKPNENMPTNNSDTSESVVEASNTIGRDEGEEEDAAQKTAIEPSNASPSESGSHHDQEEVDELSAAEIELIEEKKKEVEFVANPELDTSMSIDFDDI
jgi:hypothetical protein